MYRPFCMHIYLKEDMKMAYAIGGAEGASIKKDDKAVKGALSGAGGKVVQAGNSINTGSGSGSSKSGTPTVPQTQSSDNSGAYYAMLEAQLASQRAAAKEAYNRNMSRIASAYGSAAGSLRDNYNSTVDRLNAARDKSMGDVNNDAEKSLREAYINNMLTKKNLNQRLSAMGYNGGATESTMASLDNNYGNSRTGINETLNRNISDLNQTYGDNLASALQSYNSAKANLDMQRMQLENQAESMYNNMSQSSLSGIGSLLQMDQSYVNALANALSKQNDYTYDPTVATNDFVAGQAQQAQSADSGNAYAKWKAQAELEAANGATKSQILNNLYESVRAGELDMATLAQIRDKLKI